MSDYAGFSEDEDEDEMRFTADDGPTKTQFLALSPKNSLKHNKTCTSSKNKKAKISMIEIKKGPSAISHVSVQTVNHDDQTLRKEEDEFFANECKQRRVAVSEIPY